VQFLPDLGWSIPKKILKKFNKLKNVILASFLAKLGRFRPKNRLKFFLCEYPFYPTPEDGAFQKKEKEKRFKKLKKRHSGFIFDKMGQDRPKKR